VKKHMSETIWVPPAGKDFNAAKRQFVELYGSTAVMNTYLKIALVCLCGVCLGLVWLVVRTSERLHNVKPLIIRINELGRAEAMSHQSFEYRPQEQEIKYFLIEFVQRHYSRMRATVRENYTRSLYFLDGRLADAAIDASKKNKTIEAFLTGGGDDIEVSVKNVAIEDLRQAPYKATVDFEKIYYGAGDHAERKREKYVAHVVFIVKDHVANDMVPINPLGLTITYFREDQAFD
jgi:type IV secretory pathway TrbF-like protein